MSDDFDDPFDIDDSFLREVDTLTARAIAHKPAPTSTRAPSLPVLPTAPKGWTGVQRCTSGPSKLPFKPKSPIRIPKPPSQDLVLLSDDEFDDLPASALAALDRVTAGRSIIPSSRLTVKGGSGVQTHLNIRRGNQATKGKRWDRTLFAESGRRVGAAGRKKGKTKIGAKRRRDSDEEEEESEECEDEDGLAPPPKPLVDITAAYEPQRHCALAATTGTYIYPTNRPKRDYQYEIVRACFTDNCLVALPTGLGKTFVAGVVMLNFYRWFPSGKIVFLAPTKPLVNQQIEACQLSCGIPSGDAAVMTGSSIGAKERAKMWAERRVFYCTPQTLDNDLKSGAVDPRDIVLAVFDEAHKASGSYAYTTILAYITAHHPYFRVLALTATPGADVPRVQAVVDALHISRIEIREAEAPEIRKYMNEKRTEKHFVQMGPVIEEFRDRWAALVRPYVAKLVEKDILNERDLDIKRLRPFRITATRMEIARRRDSGMMWAFGSLQSIERMARAMGHLLEFSLGMFHSILLEIAGANTAQGKKGNSKAGANAMRNNFEFQRLLRDVEAEMNCISIGQKGKTKADRHPKMVKTLDLLLEHFSNAAEDEKRGVKNDTRAMVFCSFRSCVMEIVEMLNDQPGLLRATKFVGQSQGKQEEDKGFNQKEQKKTIQEFKDGKYNILVSTSIGEEGLDIGEVDFVVIYDMPRQSIKLLQRVGRTGRKRDGKVHVLMSEGREDANWDSAQQTHREIQEEILHSRNLELFEDVEPLLDLRHFPECVEQEMPVDPWDPSDQKARKALAGAKTKPNSPKGKVKKARGHEVPEGHEGFKSVAELLKAKGSSRKRGRSITPPKSEESEDSEEVEEDLADLFERYESTGRKRRGMKAAVPRKAPRPAKKGRPSKASTEAPAINPSQEDAEERERQDEAEREARNRIALDFFNTVGPVRRRQPTPLATPPSSPPVPRLEPKLPLSPPTDESLTTGVAGQTKLTPRTAAAAGFSQLDPIDLSWEMDLPPSSPPRPPLGQTRSTLMMPPPPVPVRSSSPKNITPVLEATQFPVRRIGRRRPAVVATSSSDRSDYSRGALQRLRARQDSSPVPAQETARAASGRRVKRRAPPEQVKAFLDLDVEISGSDGSPDEPSSDVESESDRRFANDFQPTQAPAGYNQRAMYAAGLSTQAAPRAGLAFKPRHDTQAFLAKARRPVQVTDDEASDANASENEYELGSFVCEDGDLSFATQSDPLSCS